MQLAFYHMPSRRSRIERLNRNNRNRRTSRTSTTRINHGAWKLFMLLLFLLSLSILLLLLGAILLVGIPWFIQIQFLKASERRKQILHGEWGWACGRVNREVEARQLLDNDEEGIIGGLAHHLQGQRVEIRGHHEGLSKPSSIQFLMVMIDITDAHRTRKGGDVVPFDAPSPLQNGRKDRPNGLYE